MNLKDQKYRKGEKYEHTGKNQFTGRPAEQADMERKGQSGSMPENTPGDPESEEKAGAYELE